MLQKISYFIMTGAVVSYLICYMQKSGVPPPSVVEYLNFLVEIFSYVTEKVKLLF